MAFSRHDPEEPITQINVVPLVDIMLVLLIIFMLTASFISTPSVSVHVPKSYTSDPTIPASQSLVLNTKGEIYYQDKKIDKPELSAKIKEDVGGNPGLRIVLSADESVPTGKLVELLDVVRQAGVSQIALGVSKP